MITGRVADASLTVAPAVHEFGWEWTDWDRLAAGTVAGHLIECGAQVTGGLWCNWQEASDLANVGYPIAEIEESGTFRITKPPGTGGAVNRETVSEQLLYEVGDPAAYLTPDVMADFTSVTLSESGPDTVQVHGARGQPATDTYKVSIAYRDGYTASGTLVSCWPPDSSQGTALWPDDLPATCGERGSSRNTPASKSWVAADCVPGVLECSNRTARSGPARQRPRLAASGGGALHQGVCPTGYFRTTGRDRVHNGPAPGARSARLLAGPGA